VSAGADAMGDVGWVERSDTHRSGRSTTAMAGSGNDGYRPAASTHPTHCIAKDDVGFPHPNPSPGGRGAFPLLPPGEGPGMRDSRPPKPLQPSPLA
jgi:hypothetical protein